MAQYTINHTCGHTQVHDLFGPYEQRERTIKWQTGCICDACYRTQKIADEQAAAAKLEAQMTLPALTGSEKQINWAKSIRAKMIADGPINPEYKDALVKTDSRWFIERR